MTRPHWKDIVYVALETECDVSPERGNTHHCLSHGVWFIADPKKIVPGARIIECPVGDFAAEVWKRIVSS